VGGADGVITLVLLGIVGAGIGELGAILTGVEAGVL